MTATPDKRPAFEPPAQLLQPTGFDPDMQRPPSTVAGVVLVLLRVLAGVLVMIAVLLEWPTIIRGLDISFEDFAPSREVLETSLLVIGIAFGAFLLIDAVLAFFIFFGHNWARVVVMTFSALSITAAFGQWWAGGQEITISNTLLSLGLDILILLALSSRAAAAYARRNGRRRPDPSD